MEYISKDEYIPVIAPIGVFDDNGQSYNINADSVAAAVAAATAAEKLILLTDVEGVKDSDGNVIFETGEDEINEMIDNGTIVGGMMPVFMGCLDSIHSRCKRRTYNRRSNPPLSAP